MANLTNASFDALPRGLHITYLAVGLPLGAVVCLGNVILMAVIADPKGPLKIATRTMLCSLVFCDVVAGAVLMLHSGFIGFDDGVRDYCAEGCLMWGIMLTLPVYCAFVHLSVICLERRHAVMDPANAISGGRATLYCAGVWAYCVVLCVAGMLFIFLEDSTAWSRCDVVTLPPFYLLILGIHLVVVSGVVVGAAINIRSTLRLHQRKIQVTNTITYSNLVEDTQVAWVFVCAFVVQLLPCLPFIVALATVAAGMRTEAAVVVARVCYIVAQLSGLKFLLYMKMSKDIRKACVQRLSCSSNQPHMSPSHTN
jgi:hypothetical protein